MIMVSRVLMRRRAGIVVPVPRCILTGNVTLGARLLRRTDARPMASRDAAFVEITPEVLLKAYACGIFPMAESAEDPALYWIEPEQRGVIPLAGFHIPARLARTVRAEHFTVLCNRDCEAVIDACAEPY